MKNSSARSDHGFTLIELSIVIIIVGLIAGGIIGGASILENSRNRSQVAQITDNSAALNTFRLKYGYLPGDIPDGTAFGLTHYTTYRNGNGYINDYQNNIPILSAWGEPYEVFRHLSESGLNKGKFAGAAGTYSFCEPTKQFAPLKVGSGGIIATSFQNNVWWYLGLNVCSTTNQLLMSALSTAGVLSPPQARYIDAKLDDGKPQTGNVRAVTATAGTLDVTDGNCVSQTATIYNFAKDTLECRLYVKAQ